MLSSARKLDVPRALIAPSASPKPIVVDLVAAMRTPINVHAPRHIFGRGNPAATLEDLLKTNML